MPPYLELKDISKSFSGVRALRGVNLRLEQGEIRCLVGENGSGKSTLIKLVAGIIRPDSGSVLIDGEEHSFLRPRLSIAKGIQVIYQDFSLFPNLTVAENVALNTLVASGRRTIDRGEMNEIARKAMERLQVRLDPDALVEELPVASKQLVAIVRAVVQGARLIIMDEPTTALTRQEIERLLAIMEEQKRRGVSALFVTHKLDEVLKVSDTITVLRNGRVVADEEARQFDTNRLTFFMTGREIAAARFRHEKNSGERPFLRVRGLNLPGAYRDVSFDLYRGEILGITGTLGCGATELALSLFGFQPAKSGTIEISGGAVRVNSVRDAMRLGIAYVPEDRLSEGLLLPVSIARNMALSVIDRLSCGGFLRMHRVRESARSWLEKLRIAAPSVDIPVRNLSGGNQQRVLLARWLATEPRLLILNAPTAGVDVGSKAEIHALLRELAYEGMTVLIISNDIPELLSTCSRILLMREGRVVGETSADASEWELMEALAG